MNEEAREQKILAERALLLSRQTNEPASSAESLELLEFKLAGERCAVETAFVEAVLPLRELTPLPGAPDHVLGIVYVRGRVFCLNNLARLLGLPNEGLNERDTLILLRKPGMELAVLAEEILGSRSVDRARIHAIASNGNADRKYVLGVTDEGTSFLDAAALLDDPRLVVNQTGKQRREKNGKNRLERIGSAASSVVGAIDCFGMPEYQRDYDRSDHLPDRTGRPAARRRGRPGWYSVGN
jgi:purine-binding chemotaxis protein CheW